MVLWLPSPILVIIAESRSFNNTQQDQPRTENCAELSPIQRENNPICVYLFLTSFPPLFLLNARCMKTIHTSLCINIKDMTCLLVEHTSREVETVKYPVCLSYSLQSQV